MQTSEKTADSLRPIDDVLFHLMYDDIPACEQLLQTIFNDDKLKVLSVEMQDDIANLEGRGVRLDAKCRMADGSVVNVEVQRANDDDHFRRIRYNASVLTAKDTPKSTKFRDVKEVYAVFISEFDPIETWIRSRIKARFLDKSVIENHKPKTIYYMDSVVRGTDFVIDDGFHRILVNAKVSDGSKVSRLMSLFVKEDFDDAEFPVSSERIRRFKHTEEGRKAMCDRVLQYAQDYAKEERTIDGNIMIYSLVQDGDIAPETGARRLGLTIDQLKANMLNTGYKWPDIEEVKV